jgi:tripartite-type tricarboxylate transporter receptor subunit TctC
MRKVRKVRVPVLLLIVLMVLVSVPGCASEPAVNWPEKTVTIVVPYDAGGDSDFNARALVEKLTKISGQSFIITNISGNSGATGSLQALSANPDGYTILFNHTAFAVNYFSNNSKLTYDDVTFGAICGISPGSVIVVPASKGINTFAELVSYSHEHPGELLFGGSAGSLVYLTGLQIRRAGVDFTMVDAGGTASRLAAILGGHVDFTSMAFGAVKDYIETGELVALCSNAEFRTSLYDVYGIRSGADEGYDIGAMLYYQMLFPKGTDPKIVEKLNELLEQVIFNDEEYAKRIWDVYLQEPYYKNAEEGEKIILEWWDKMAALDWEL